MKVSSFDTAPGALSCVTLHLSPFYSALARSPPTSGTLTLGTSFGVTNQEVVTFLLLGIHFSVNARTRENPTNKFSVVKTAGLDTTAFWTSILNS